MRVREKISDKTVNYPNAELIPLIGHTGLEEYYEIVKDDHPIYDGRTHKDVRSEQYTTDIGVLLPIWRVSFTVQQLGNAKIKKALEEAADSWIEEHYSQRKQNRLFRKGIANPSHNKYNNMVTFMNTVEAEQQVMEDALPLIPSFIFSAP